MELRQAIAQRVTRSRKGTLFTPSDFPEADPRLERAGRAGP